MDYMAQAWLRKESQGLKLSKRALSPAPVKQISHKAQPAKIAKDTLVTVSRKDSIPSNGYLTYKHREQDHADSHAQHLPICRMVADMEDPMP
jgi:hypothetical protein